MGMGQGFAGSQFSTGTDQGTTDKWTNVQAGMSSGVGWDNYAVERGATYDRGAAKQYSGMQSQYGGYDDMMLPEQNVGYLQAGAPVGVGRSQPYDHYGLSGLMPAGGKGGSGSRGSEPNSSGSDKPFDRGFGRRNQQPSQANVQLKRTNQPPAWPSQLNYNSRQSQGKESAQPSKENPKPLLPKREFSPVQITRPKQPQPSGSNQPVSQGQNQKVPLQKNSPEISQSSRPTPRQPQIAGAGQQGKQGQNQTAAASAKESPKPESKTPAFGPGSVNNTAQTESPETAQNKGPQQSQQNKSAESKPANTPVSVLQSQQNKSAESKPANTPVSAPKPSSEGTKQQAGSAQNAKPGQSGSESTTKQSQGKETGKSKPPQQPEKLASQDSKPPPCNIPGSNSKAESGEKLARHDDIPSPSKSTETKMVTAVSQGSTAPSTMPEPNAKTNASVSKNAEKGPANAKDDEDDDTASFCKVCNMAFQGPEQFFRHTRGLLHTQRQMAEAEKDEKEEKQKKKDSEDSDEDTSFCKLCNMAFEGPEHFFRHTRGLLHTQRQMAADEAKNPSSTQQPDTSSTSRQQPQQNNRWGGGQDRAGRGNVARGGGNVSERGGGGLGGVRGSGRGTRGTVRGSNSRSGDRYRSVDPDTYGKGDYGYAQVGEGYAQAVKGHGQGGDSYGQGGDSYSQSGDGYGQSDNYDQGGDGYVWGGDSYDQGGKRYGQSDDHDQSGDGYGQGGDGFGNTDYGYEQGRGDGFSKAGDYAYGGSGAGDTYQGDSSYGDNYGYGQESGGYGQGDNHGYRQDSYSAGRGRGKGGSGKVDGGRDLGGGGDSYGMGHGNAYGYERGDGVSGFKTGGDLDSSGRGRGSTSSAKGRQSVVQRLSAATTSQGLAMIGGDYEEEEDFEDEEQDEGADDENSKQSFASYKEKDSDDYHCKLCDMKTTGAVSFRAHLNGRSHKLVQDAVENGTIIPRRLMTKLGPGAQVPRKPNPLPASTKTVPVEGPSLLVDALKAVPEAIVGLRFIREYQVGKQPTFHCTICDSQCDISSIQTHLMGTKHRLKYLREHHADVYEHVRTHGGKKSQLSAFLEEVCSDIEEKQGRGVPMMEQLMQDESKTKKEEKKAAAKDDTDDDKGKGHGRRVSHDVALARYKEDKRLKEMKEKREELGYPSFDSYYERDDRMGPGPGWGPPAPRGYPPPPPPHPDRRFRDLRDDPRFRDYPDPRFADLPDDRMGTVMSQEERHRLMYEYERHNFYYADGGLPPAEQRRRMFLEYERLEIPYEVAWRRVMIQEDRLYRMSQYLRDGLDIDDARRRVLAEDNRRQLMLAYERQGLSATEAKWRVIMEEERAKLFDDYERRGIPPLEARERIMAGKDRMGLIHEYERRGMPPEEARYRAMEEENRIKRDEERLRRGVIDDESESAVDKMLTGIAEQRLMENYIQQGLTKDDAKNRLIADLRRQGIPTQEAIQRVERIVVKPDLTVEEERTQQSFSPERDRDRARSRESSRPRDRNRADPRENLGPRGREMGDSRERLGSVGRERADSRERFGPRGRERADFRERFGPRGQERADSRERLASRDGDHSRDGGRCGPPDDRDQPPKSGGDIDSLSAEEAKERLLQEYMKLGVPREEARKGLINELIRQGVAPDEARRRLCDPPKAYRAQEEGRHKPGSRRSKSPSSSRSRSRSRSREQDLSLHLRRDFEGQERDRGQQTPGRDRGPPGREREFERQREVRQDVEKQRRDPARVAKEQPQQAAKKAEPEEGARPTLTLGEELKRMRMKRAGHDMPSEVPAKQARLPASNPAQAVRSAPSTVPPPAPFTSQRPQYRRGEERPVQPSTSDAAPMLKGEVKDLLESLTNNLISSEDDASMALHVSKALTSALLKYRLKSLPGQENSPGSASAAVSSFVERRMVDAKKIFEKKAAPPATSTVQTPSVASQQRINTPSQQLGKQQEIGSKGIGVAPPKSTTGLHTIPLPPQQGFTPSAPPPRMNTPEQMPRGAAQSKPRALIRTLLRPAGPRALQQAPPAPDGQPAGFRPTHIYRAGQRPPQAAQEEKEEKPGGVFDRPLGQSLSRGPILPRVIQTQCQLHGGAGENKGRGQQQGGHR